MKARLLAPVLLLALPLLCNAAPAAPRASIVIHGHRGARARLPENTLPAFEYALKIGVDFLEMDLAVTRDNVLVISHDPRVNPEICLAPDGSRITRPPLIHDLVLSELKRYDCGALRNPRFADQKPVPGTRIPTLEEVFALVKNSKLPAAKTVRFNIETKIFADHPEHTVGPEEFVDLALKAFERSGFADRIVIQSFDPRTLVLARRKAPGMTRSMLIEDPGKDMVQACRETGARIVSPKWELLTDKRVAKLHQAGLAVHPWTANDPGAWGKLIDMGAEGIITDDPEALKAYLGKRP